MGIETAYHILSAHLWTNTVVGHEVWRNRQRCTGQAPGSACARAKGRAAGTAPPTAKPPPFSFFDKCRRFEVQISFALRPDLARKSTKSYKNAFISHPSQTFLKLNEENNGKMMVACK